MRKPVPSNTSIRSKTRMMRFIVAAALSMLALVSAPQDANVQVWEKLVAPGMVYRMEYDAKTPMTVHAVRLSMQSPAVAAVPVLAGQTVFEDNDSKGRGSVTQMVRENKAIGGINADFFALSGDPLGLMVHDGELISTPFNNRAVFAWGPKDAAIGIASFSGLMTGGGATVQIDGVNEACGDNMAVLNTQRAGAAVSSGPCKMLIVRYTAGKWAPSTVMRGVIVEILDDESKLEVQPRTVVLVVRGRRAQTVSDLHVGTNVKFLLQTSGFDWETMDQAVGGGPLLLRAGKFVDDSAAEGFRDGFANARHPRTAIGKTATGELWFVTIEGRQETGAGATTEEAAHVMARLGCVDAINLDGGGSTELALRGMVMNRPSDGSERLVANGIVFVPKVGLPELTPVPASIVITGSPAAKRAATAKVVETGGRIVPNSEVLWSSTGSAGWVDQGGLIHGVKNGRITVYAFAAGKRLSTTVEVDSF